MAFDRQYLHIPIYLKSKPVRKIVRILGDIEIKVDEDSTRTQKSLNVAKF